MNTEDHSMKSKIFYLYMGGMTVIFICTAITILRIPTDFRVGIIPKIDSLEMQTHSEIISLKERMATLENKFNIKSVESPVYKYMDKDLLTQ